MLVVALLWVVPPQAVSTTVMRTIRLSKAVKDLTFTLEGAARRELRDIYNLLPLDERIPLMILLNSLWIAQLYM